MHKRKINFELLKNSNKLVTLINNCIIKSAFH